MTIKELINRGKNILIKNYIKDESILARMLLEYVLNKDKQYLIINQDENVDDKNEQEYGKLIKKIIDGTPIQYITHNQEFMKLNFYVDENVLIPQPDTEILVEEVLDICNKKTNEIEDINKLENIKILDICTGSGAIGISIAKNIENVQIVESDISIKALQIAKLNCEKNRIKEKIKFIQSDMFKKIDEKFNIIVSNPPYISKEEIKRLDKTVLSEPMLALDGGIEGLDFYKVLINESYKYLEKDGYLCMEMGYNQKKKVINLLKQSDKYKEIYCKKDLSKNDRVVIAKVK